MTSLPREVQPHSALEERVVSTLVAAGLVRRRRVLPAWVGWTAAAAAVLVLGVGIAKFRAQGTLAPGNTYAILLYEDSTYRPTPVGHDAERVAEVARWADSLDALGELERAGRLFGPGPLGGLILVRAADYSGAARIAVSCPFRHWGGRVVVKRFQP